jgi:hypothetical protein
MRATHLVPIVFVVATWSCKAERESREHPRPTAAMTGATPLRMRNCPSAVASAKTIATRTVSGIDLTITSTDAAARARIVALAQLQSSQRDPVRLLPPHTSMHTGPGTVGRCPVIHADTGVSYELAPDGVTIHVAANRPTDVAQLQTATESRVRALAPST